MISIDRKLDIRPVYDFDLLAPKERIVFFDIETTGLKASTAALYLIGAVTYEDGSWCLLFPTTPFPRTVIFILFGFIY